uniref:Saposin B-type domain-containing protein n=1 Tax=Cyprinus carpio TaxID=7962 RepID=A0A8C2D806_CYPCA
IIGCQIVLKSSNPALGILSLMYHQHDSEQYLADGMPKQQSSSECIICKLIVKAVKTLLSHKPTDEIKTKLKKGCDVLNQRKDPCKNFVEKYMNKLIKELMTDDAPNKLDLYDYAERKISFHSFMCPYKIRHF